MPKNKTHKGLMKRIRITKSGKVKLRRAHGRHLRSHKPGSLIRRYRRPKYASDPDTRRVRCLLGLKLPAAKRSIQAGSEPATV